VGLEKRIAARNAMGRCQRMDMVTLGKYALCRASRIFRARYEAAEESN
jgi:hypothetical protein